MEAKQVDLLVRNGKKIKKNILQFIDKIFLSLVLIIFIQMPLYSTHFMGGDISYECLGGNQYLIRLNVFRDCNGTTFEPNLPLTIFSSECNYTLNDAIGIEPNYPIVITPLCDQEIDLCDSDDGVYGVQYYRYEYIITLAPGCSDYQIGFADCCRNSAISTINMPNNESFYIGALLNTQDASCNSSPVFNNNPTPFSCVGQEVNYNHGVTDPDGDELVFSLVNCNSDYGSSVNYQAGFSGTTPLTADNISIDPNTGAISFIPTALQVGVLCVLVEEYRNGVKIGEVVRDMQFTVLNCATNTIDENILPVLSGIDGTADANGVTGAFETEVCFGFDFCFDLVGFDMDGHNLEISWNESIEDATLVVNNNGTPNANAQFCWAPTVDDIGINFFTITLMDDACDIRGINTYTFKIEVGNGSLNYDFTASPVTCHGGNDGSATVTILETLNNPTFTWQTTPEQTGLTANNLAAGFYNLLVEDSSIECGYSFLEIEITEPNPIVVDTLNYSNVSCGGYSDGLIEVNVSGDNSPFNLNWSNAITSNLNANLMAGTYTLIVTDNVGCTQEKIYVITEPTPIYLDTILSNYHGYQVSCPEGNDGMVNLIPFGGTSPYQYNWSNGEITEDLENIMAGIYTCTVTDIQGCIDSIVVSLDHPPAVISTFSSTPISCYGNNDGTIIIENITGGVAPYFWSSTGDTFHQIDSFEYIIPNQGGGENIIYIQDADACISTETVYVGFPDSLIVEIIPSDTLLQLGEEISVSFVTNSTDTYQFEWNSLTTNLECDSCMSFVLQPLETTYLNLHLIEDTKGCTAFAEGIVRINNDIQVYVPNAFSPNEDGFNERLTVYAETTAIQQINSFQVFDRWGALVFQNQNFLPNDFQEGWDGLIHNKLAPVGVYVYTLEVELINGEKRMISGDITLLR